MAALMAGQKAAYSAALMAVYWAFWLAGETAATTAGCLVVSKGNVKVAKKAALRAEWREPH